MNTKQQFISDLVALGVCPNDTIMVKLLGGIEDGSNGLFMRFCRIWAKTERSYLLLTRFYKATKYCNFY